jgi:predicted secreted protein
MEPDEEQINLKTANEQTPERVTINSIKIDDEVIALDIVRRAEKRFVFEITRENRNRLVATSDEHKTAKSAARAGKPIWKRTVKTALNEKLDQ